MQIFRSITDAVASLEKKLESAVTIRECLETQLRYTGRELFDTKAQLRQARSTLRAIGQTNAVLVRHDGFERAYQIPDDSIRYGQFRTFKESRRESYRIEDTRAFEPVETIDFRYTGKKDVLGRVIFEEI